MSKITTEQVKQVADLAHLEFSNRELDTFIGEFQEILDYFEQLREVNTDDAAPLYHALASASEETPWRSDAVRESLPRQEVLAEAPETDGEHFRVPKVIE